MIIGSVVCSPCPSCRVHPTGSTPSALKGSSRGVYHITSVLSGPSVPLRRLPTGPCRKVRAGVSSARSVRGSVASGPCCQVRAARSVRGSVASCPCCQVRVTRSVRGPWHRVHAVRSVRETVPRPPGVCRRVRAAGSMPPGPCGRPCRRVSAAGCLPPGPCGRVRASGSVRPGPCVRVRAARLCRQVVPPGCAARLCRQVEPPGCAARLCRQVVPPGLSVPPGPCRPPRPSCWGCPAWSVPLCPFRQVCSV